MLSKFLRKSYLLTIFVFLFPLNSYGNNQKYSDFFSDWSSGFFADLGIHSYIPIAIHEYAAPKVGFRAGLGYHFFNDYNHSVLFAVNSGWSFISGTNPLVRTLDLVPLSFLTEYNFSPVNFFSINIGAGCGVFLSSVSRYKAAVDLIQNNLAYENNELFFIHANLGTSFKFLKNSFAVCLDLGVDILPENDGPIPLPYVSLSTKFYPFRIAKYPKKQKVEKVVEKVIEYSAEKIIEYPDEIDSITKIYFSENSTELWDSYKPILNYLALYLKGLAEKNNNIKNNQNAEKKFSVVLTGYSAPYGLEYDQDDIAEQRARVIMEYLADKTKLEDDSFLVRIKTADFDVEGLPATVTNAHLQKYRVVEIKIRDKSNNRPKAQPIPAVTQDTPKVKNATKSQNTPEAKSAVKPQDTSKAQTPAEIQDTAKAQEASKAQTTPAAQNTPKVQNEAKPQTASKKVFSVFSFKKESEEEKAAEAKKIAEAKKAKEARKAQKAAEARKAKEAKKALKAKKAAEAKKAKEALKAKKAAEAKKAKEALKAQKAAEAEKTPKAKEATETSKAEENKETQPEEK